MRVIIAGGRDFDDYNLMIETIKNSKYNITTVICGGASGADALGERYAYENSIPVGYYPADWEKNGKAAGPIRNKQMADTADALIAFWDGKSPGTKNMIDEMSKRGLPVTVTFYNFEHNTLDTFF